MKTFTDKLSEEYALQVRFDEARERPGALRELLNDPDYDVNTFMEKLIDYDRAKLIGNLISSSKVSTQNGEYAEVSNNYQLGKGLHFDHVYETGKTKDLIEESIIRLSKELPLALESYKNLSIIQLSKKLRESKGEEGAREYEALSADYLNKFDEYANHYMKLLTSLISVPEEHLGQYVAELFLGNKYQEYNKTNSRIFDQVKLSVKPLEMRHEIAKAPFNDYIENEIISSFVALYRAKGSKKASEVALNAIKDSGERMMPFGLDVYSVVEKNLENGVLPLKNYNVLKFELNQTLKAFFSNYSTPSNLLNTAQNLKTLETFHYNKIYA